METKHRKFTYREQTINGMSREQLLTMLFLPKINEDKLRYHLRKEEGIILSIRKTRQVKIHLDLTRRAELPAAAYGILDTIENLRDAFPEFRQAEVVAIVLGYLEQMKRGEEQDQAIHKAFVDHIEGWETSMERLNF